MNEDENLVCDGCGDERPSSSAASQSIGSRLETRQDFEDARPSIAPSTPPKSLDQDDDEEENASLQGKDDDSDKDESVEANDEDADADSELGPFGARSSSASGDDDESAGSLTSPDFSSDSDLASPLPSSSAPPTSSFDEPEPVSSSYSPPSPPPSPQPTYSSSSFSTSSSTAGQRYYLVFVNTPAQSLIKSRVSVDFDDFPVISIGRNPENIVVIPDQEVSRKHAELAIENGKLVLKDLKSANGTYLYDGKQFNRVNGSVEVKPNSVLKFGTGTIVRLENG